MLRLLQLLLVGHIHRWKTIETRRLQDVLDHPTVSGTRYVQQCEKCGIVKKRDLI